MKTALLAIAVLLLACAPTPSTPSFLEPDRGRPAVAAATLLEFTGDTAGGTVPIPANQITGRISAVAESLGRAGRRYGVDIQFARTSGGVLAFYSPEMVGSDPDTSDIPLLAYITSSGQYRHGRPPRVSDSLGPYLRFGEPRFLRPWDAKRLTPTDSAAVYRTVLDAGVDTILGDSVGTRRLVYLNTGYLENEHGPKFAPSHPSLRPCRVRKRRGCPEFAARSLDLDTLRVFAMDTVQVPFAVDAHRKQMPFWGPSFSPEQVMQAWQMGLFVRYGTTIVGGCFDAFDNGRHLTLVRNGATWRVTGIGYDWMRLGALCA